MISIQSVTIAVRDLDASVRLFREKLGLDVVSDTHASVGLLSVWKRPVHEAVRLVDLGKVTGQAGLIRLASFQDYGLTADTAAQQKTTGGKLLLGPSAIAFQGQIIEPKSDGSVSITDSDAKSGTPQTDFTAWIVAAATPVGAPTQVGAATPVAFYSETLGLEQASDSPQKPKAVLARAVGNEPVEVSTFTDGWDATLRFAIARAKADKLPQQLNAMRPGQAGFNLFTCRHDDLDELLKRFQSVNIEPVTLPTHVGRPVGHPARVLIIPGPNGELFEFVENTM